MEHKESITILNISPIISEGENEQFQEEPIKETQVLVPDLPPRVRITERNEDKADVYHQSCASEEHSDDNRTNGGFAPFTADDASSSLSLSLKDPLTESRNNNNTSSSSFQMFRMEHKAFVLAVFSIGIYTATPQLLHDAISPYMKQKYPDVNDLARIKSKLQKYRRKPETAVDEFTQVYDSALRVLFNALRGRNRPKKTDLSNLSERTNVNLGKWSLLDPDDLMNQLLHISRYFSSGEKAAFCSFLMLPILPTCITKQMLTIDETTDDESSFMTTSLNRKRKKVDTHSKTKKPFRKRNVDASDTGHEMDGKNEKIEEYVTLDLPVLSEAEKQTGIGKVWTSFIHTFTSYIDEINRQRQNNVAQSKNMDRNSTQVKFVDPEVRLQDRIQKQHLVSSTVLDYNSKKPTDNEMRDEVENILQELNRRQISNLIMNGALSNTQLHSSYPSETSQASAATVLSSLAQMPLPPPPRQQAFPHRLMDSAAGHLPLPSLQSIQQAVLPQSLDQLFSNTILQRAGTLPSYGNLLHQYGMTSAQPASNFRFNTDSLLSAGRNQAFLNFPNIPLHFMPEMNGYGLGMLPTGVTLPQYNISDLIRNGQQQQLQQQQQSNFDRQSKIYDLSKP